MSWCKTHSSQTCIPRAQTMDLSLVSDGFQFWDRQTLKSEWSNHQWALLQTKLDQHHGSSAEQTGVHNGTWFQTFIISGSEDTSWSLQGLPLSSAVRTSCWSAREGLWTQYLSSFCSGFVPRGTPGLYIMQYFLFIYFYYNHNYFDFEEFPLKEQVIWKTKLKI